MGDLLALVSACCFGTTHFVGGLLARRAHGVTVALYAQLGGTVLSLPIALVAGHGAPGGPSLGWGALSGLGTGVGVAFLYRALNKGAMSVVVPVTDVTADALPVLVGLAALGERPTPLSLTGIAATFPALWLVSRGTGAGRPAAEEAAVSRGDGDAAVRPGRRATAPVHGLPAVADALIAGAGFALQFLAMARIPADAGLWPVVLSRVASVAVVACFLVRLAVPWTLPSRLTLPAVAAGAVGTVAILLYLYATRQQLMSVATVLTSLYVAIPVVLALVFLRERTTVRQTTGLLCAAAAIVLIALA